jgi:zinc protease
MMVRQVSRGVVAIPDVLVGGLPNGLRFYVRPNGKPATQIELRLVVKAGSVLEDEDQRGLALRRAHAVRGLPALFCG